MTLKSKRKNYHYYSTRSSVLYMPDMSEAKKQAKERKDEHIESSPFKQAVYGASGGIASATICYPLDVVKAHIQVTNSPYSGMLDAAQGIVKQHGVLALYAGLNSEYIKTASQSFFYCYFHSTFKNLYRNYMHRKPTVLAGAVKVLPTDTNMQQKDIPISHALLIGLVSGICTQPLVNPLNVIQTRLITSDDQSLGLIGTATKILKEEGIQSMFTGLGASLILTMNPAIQFMVFDRLKSMWLRHLGTLSPPRQTATAIELFLIGAIAKIIATIVTYPYIMAKIRLQSNPHYKGILHVLGRALKHEGWTGLYVGLGAQITKSVLGAAFMLMFKEKIEEFVTHIFDKTSTNSPTSTTSPSLV